MQKRKEKEMQEKGFGKEIRTYLFEFCRCECDLNLVSSTH